MEKNILLLFPSLGKLDREPGLLSEDQRSALQATAESAHGVPVSRLLVVVQNWSSETIHLVKTPHGALVSIFSAGVVCGPSSWDQLLQHWLENITATRPVAQQLERPREAPQEGEKKATELGPRRTDHCQSTIPFFASSLVYGWILSRNGEASEANGSRRGLGSGQVFIYTMSVGSSDTAGERRAKRAILTLNIIFSTFGEAISHTCPHHMRANRVWVGLQILRATTSD